MIRFQCPVCKTVMSVPDTDAGRKGDCPKCGQRLQIPSVPAKPVVNPSTHVSPQATAPGQGTGRMPPALPSWQQSPPPRRHEQPRRAQLPESKAQTPDQPPPVPASGSIGDGVRDAAKDFLKAIGKRAAAKVKEVAASAQQAPRAKPAETSARETSPFSRLAAMAPAPTERQPTKRSPWASLGIAAGLFLLVSMCAGVTILGLGVNSLSQMTWPAGSAGESKADGEPKAGTHKLSLPFLSISKGVLDGDTAKIERVIHSSPFFMDMTEATAQDMAYEIRAVAQKNPTAKKVEFKLLMDKRHLSDKYGNACPEDQMMGTISADLDEARKYASDDDYVIRMKPFFAAQIRMMKHAEMLRPR